MKKIYILLIFVCITAFACKETIIVEEQKTIEITKINFPIISSDINEIQTYLSSKNLEYSTWNDDNKVYLHAYIVEKKEDLLKEVTYSLALENSCFSSLSVDFIYNKENPSDAEKKQVRDSLIERTIFKFD
jgi:hypothetical protein